MDAWGLRAVHADRAPAPVVWPATLAQCRHRRAPECLEALGAIQAAAALAAGRGRPAPLRVAPFPSEPGRQRVTDATTLSQAPKTCGTAASGAASQARARPRACSPRRRHATRPCPRSGGHSAPAPGPPPARGAAPAPVGRPGGRARRAAADRPTRAAPDPRQKARSGPHRPGVCPPPWPLSAQAKAMVPPSAGATSVCAPRPFPACAWLLGCPRASRVSHALGGPCATRGHRPAPSSPPPRAGRSTPWGVSAAAMTPRDATRCLRVACFPWACRPRWSRARRCRAPQTSGTASTGRASTVCAPPHPVPLACASGSRRPGVERHRATLMSRGADHVRDKGLEGAGVQSGMTVIAPNGAVLVRLCPQRLSKRGQKCRR